MLSLFHQVSRKFPDSVILNPNLGKSVNKLTSKHLVMMEYFVYSLNTCLQFVQFETGIIGDIRVSLLSTLWWAVH